MSEPFQKFTEDDPDISDLTPKDAFCLGEQFAFFTKKIFEPEEFDMLVTPENLPRMMRLAARRNRPFRTEWAHGCQSESWVRVIVI